MNRKWFLLLGIIVFLLGGCTLAPEYKRPDAPVPAQWPTGAAYTETKSGASVPTAPDVKWQEFITDERLQKIFAWRP